MTTIDRRERERERLREVILDAASQIASEEGIDNLSIRKIASKIEYSPAAIYHYFRDKDEIVDHILKRGYQKIVGTLSSARTLHPDPEQRVKEFARGYISMALASPAEYKSFLLSDSPGVLDQTSVLFRGAREKRPTMAMLCQALREIFVQNNPDDEWIELTAQVIWSAAYGLIVRSMIEHLPEDQMERLTERHIDFVSSFIKGARGRQCINHHERETKK